MNASYATASVVAALVCACVLPCEVAAQLSMWRETNTVVTYGSGTGGAKARPAAISAAAQPEAPAATAESVGERLDGRIQALLGALGNAQLDLDRVEAVTSLRELAVRIEGPAATRALDLAAERARPVIAQAQAKIRIEAARPDPAGRIVEGHPAGRAGRSERDSAL